MRGTQDGPSSPHSLLELLPSVYASDELARRLVSAFDDTLAPVFLSLDNFAGYLDPALAPTDFLSWLGGWVSAVDETTLPEQRRRALVARAVELHAMRGTATGMAELVKLVTGRTAEITESGAVTWSAEPGTAPPGRQEGEVVVRVRGEGAEQVDPRVLESVVATTRPAHIGYRIETAPGEST